MTVWHMSDEHVGHRNCAKWRQFTGPDGEGDRAAHNRYLLTRCQALISPGDSVIHHGDTGLGPIGDRMEFFAQIPGTHTLYLGNHDELHPCNAAFRNGRRAARRRDEWEAVFGPRIYEHGAATLTSPGAAPRLVRLSHFPYKGGGDHTADERFTEWRLADTGEWLLCGHVHAKWLTKGRMINVGVDQWGMGPVPRDLLADMITVAAEGATAADLEGVRDRWVAETGGRPVIREAAA